MRLTVLLRMSTAGVRDARRAFFRTPHARQPHARQPLVLLGLIVLQWTAGAAAGVAHQSPSVSPPSSQAAPSPSPLAAEFVDWLQDHPTPRYTELARRFIEAGGRDPAAYERRMNQLAEQLRAELAGADGSVRAQAQQLSNLAFRQIQLESDLDLHDVENLFPDRILERRRGYCLGLSLLLLDLAERAGLRAVAVSAPRHTFIRMPAEVPVNLETTLSGQMHDEAWYLARFAGQVGTVPAQQVLLELGSRELAAHLINNHGYALLEAGHAAAAEVEFQRALRLAPGIVEARVNLGVLRARQKRFEEAVTHFEAARASWHWDPLVGLNLANAQARLGRSVAAAEVLVGLFDQHPSLSGLREAAAQVLRGLDIDQDWLLVQRLIVARNREVADERVRLPGLLGRYFADTRLENEALRRVDRDISFRWSWDAPAPELPRDHFSIRWEGWLEIPAEDEYTFFVTCSDGVRLWIDGRQIVNAWSRANDTFTQGSVRLLPGQHDLRIDYFESVGEAGIALILVAAGRKKALPLADHLFHPTPDRPN